MCLAVEEKWKTKSSVFSSGGEVEDYTKCELIGGVSARYLITSSTYLLLLNTKHMLCIVAIVDCC